MTPQCRLLRDDGDRGDDAEDGNGDGDGDGDNDADGDGDETRRGGR